jgi:tetratricopeptide (TPR) repeat protein
LGSTTIPKFALEKAQALARLGDHQKALELYKLAQTLNAYSSEHDNAVALRGEGFVHIEMGNIDSAERAYRESLIIEPKNKLVRYELKYIAHLRSGGDPVRAITVTTDRIKRWWQFWKR